jgi:methyl-accepting chemotaxis protein
MQTGTIAPTPPLSPSFIQICRRFSYWASTLVLVLGVIVLLSWALDIEVLKSIVPGRVTQKPNTALGLMASGGALLLWNWQTHRQPGEHHRWQRLALVVLPVLVVLLGLLTLAEYSSGWDLGINHLVWVEPSPDAVDAIAGGRPAPNTAINFLLLGSALLVSQPTAK